MAAATATATASTTTTTDPRIARSLDRLDKPGSAGLFCVRRRHAGARRRPVAGRLFLSPR